jgi:hypothetical protein
MSGPDPLIVIGDGDTATLILPFAAKRPKYLSDHERQAVQQVLADLTSLARAGRLPVDGAHWITPGGPVAARVEETWLRRKLFDNHSCRVRLPAP